MAVQGSSYSALIPPPEEVPLSQELSIHKRGSSAKATFVAEEDLSAVDFYSSLCSCRTGRV